MIIQEFTLDEYGWFVRVYYIIDKYPLDEIEKDLLALGCDEEDIEKEIEEMSKFKMNQGFIHSNLNRKMSIIIIGPTTNAAEFQDSLDHEKGHLAMHVSIANDIDPFSEKFQYLNGMIGHEMFLVAKEFLCDHCRLK